MHNIPTEMYSMIHKTMPIVCVDCIVYVDNKILMIKRTQEPMSGAWWFPGGRLMRNESLKSAAARVVKGETGINISRTIYIGHDETEFRTDPFGHGQGTHTVNFVYASNASELAVMRVVLDDNHIAHSLFTHDEIYKSNMHPYIKRFAALSEGVFRS